MLGASFSLRERFFGLQTELLSAKTMPFMLPYVVKSRSCYGPTRAKWQQSDHEVLWEKFHGIVDGLLDKIDIPGDTKS